MFSTLEWLLRVAHSIGARNTLVKPLCWRFRKLNHYRGQFTAKDQCLGKRLAHIERLQWSVAVLRWQPAFVQKQHFTQSR